MEWIIETTQKITRRSVVYAESEEDALELFMNGQIAEVTEVDESFPDIKNVWPAEDDD